MLLINQITGFLKVQYIQNDVMDEIDSKIDSASWFKLTYSNIYIYLSISISIYLSIYLYTYTYIYIYIYIYIYCLQFLFILMQNIQDNLWRSTKFTVSWKTDQVLIRKMLNWRTKRVKEIGPSVYEDPIYNEKWTIYLFWIYCWFI